MYWYIGQFPELQHLDEKDRAELLRRIGNRRLSVRLVLRVLQCAVPFGILTGVVVALTLPFPVAGYVFPVLFLLLTAAIYKVLLTRVRGQLRIYLEGAAERERLPMCLNCGYNLQGLTANRCPECGRAIPSVD